MGDGIMKTTGKLEQTLQAVIDSGIDITVSSLCDRGIDFTFLPFQKIAEGTYHLNDWHYVQGYKELADSIDSCVREIFPQSRYPLVLDATRSDLAGRDLCETLQAMYDSQIDVTITWMRQEGIGFALFSRVEYIDLKPQDWKYVPDFYGLSEALHRKAVREFANSEYAQKQVFTAPLTSAGSV
jgi:hypothetical protein